jgi:hypothetical protein
MTTYQRVHSKKLMGSGINVYRSKTVLRTLKPPSDATVSYCEVPVPTEYMHHRLETLPLWPQEDLTDDELCMVDDLKEELVKYILKKVNKLLTPSDKKIFLMYISGDYTQRQIAEEFGYKTRTPIQKSLIGFARDGEERGGSLRTVIDWANQDQKCKDLLDKIRNIRRHTYDQEEE